MRVPTKYCVLLSFLILFLSYQTIAQTELRYEHYTSSEGLSNNNTTAMEQDRYGILWIGTINGLNSFNGYDFTTYFNDENDPTTLSDNSIKDLFVDKSGTLWIATNKGLNKYLSATNNFQRYFYGNDKNKTETLLINHISSDQEGNLWLGTEKGIRILDPVNNSVRVPRIEDDSLRLFSEAGISGIHFDQKGLIWLGSSIRGGFRVVDQKTFKPVSLSASFKNVTLDGYPVREFYEDKKGIIWILSGNGLFSYQRELNLLKRFTRQEAPGETIPYTAKSIIESSDDELWVSLAPALPLLRQLYTSVAIVNPNAGTFKIYPYVDNDERGLVWSWATFIFQDRSGIYWVGTSRGLDKIDPLCQQFKLYQQFPNLKYSLFNNIYSISKDADILWLGTDGKGLIEFNLSTKSFKQITTDGFDKIRILCSLLLLQDGNLLLGTSNGLFLYNKRNNQNQHILSPPHSKGSTNVQVSCIINGEDDDVWIGWFGAGLMQYNLKTKEQKHYRNRESDNSSLASDQVNVIFRDREGILWIGFSDGVTIVGGLPGKGLDRFNPENETFTHYSYRENDTTSLSSNNVVCLAEDNNGFLWVGTRNGGLNRFDKVTGKFRRYMKKEGIPSEFITAIQVDNLNKIWFSTGTNGLGYLNQETNEVKVFDVSYGLQNLRFNRQATFKAQDGEMFFGGVSGFNSFYPEKLKFNTTPPVVYITSIKINNTYYTPDTSIYDIREMKLNYQQSDLQFDFAALNYSQTYKNKYAYKLEGYDQEWIFAGTIRFAKYTNLDPGDYVFRVKACNNDGVWNEEGASLKIIILPPWWQTAWAYLVYLLFIAGLIYLVWKAQLRRIKIKQEYEMSKFEAQKLHEVDELKSRFFTNISHEFRTPLTLILGPAKQLFEKIKDEKIKSELSLIHRNARKLLGLVNQLLDISKLESGNMKLQTSPQNIVSLLKALLLSFTSYAERKRITLKFNSVEDEIIVYIDKDKIEKIITNILSNAFKFTADGGRIETYVSRNENFVDISISDTGIGIPKEKISKIFDRFYQVDESHTREREGTGIGLSLTKELVELHKGKIEVESEEGKGTRFTVSIPLGKDHLKSDEILELEPTYKKEKEKQEYYDETENKSEQKVDIEFLGKEELPLLLIVEDNSDVRSYINDNLNLEYRVLEAVDGEDGWNKSIEQIPDLIVSDVMMPKMDGFKLCEKLKTDERTSHIPVILLTAKVAKEDKLTGYETGADEYLMKPFEPDELRVRIKNLIEQRKRLHQHFQKEGPFELNQSKITPVDKKFLQKAYSIISQNLSNESFGVEVFAEKLFVSKSLLHKKFVALTGEAPVEFIRRVRLNRAAKLIENKFGNLSEIAMEVGFNNPSYFAECFKKQFGITPSQYHRNNKTSM